jgi:hypothetical protein
MKKRLFFVASTILFLSICFCSNIKAQAIVNTRIICQMPSQLGESSGIYVASANAIWSHGDSGNPNEIYLFDTTGALKRTVVIRNAVNIDWEEMAADAQGNLYVGDFGNNNNARQDLSIYKIMQFNTLLKDTVYDAGKIQFSYPDQTLFPPAISNYVFDCEAMMAFEDSIFLATKDYHAKPYSGLTRIYRIPNAVGSHIATFVAQVNTDNSDKQLGSITGMAISSDRKKVVLTSHRRLYLAENFVGRAFWSVKWRTADINSFGNKEAVAFRDSCNLYLTDDNGGVPSGFLYNINLCQLRTALTPTIETPTQAQLPLSINCFPNPFGEDGILQVALSKTVKSAMIEVFDSTGKLFYTLEKSNLTTFELPNSIFKSQKGIFLIRIRNVLTGELSLQKISKL